MFIVCIGSMQARHGVEFQEVQLCYDIDIDAEGLTEACLNCIISSYSFRKGVQICPCKYA